MGEPHERLEAWKFSMELAKSVYEMTANFPAEERYGLAQQMQLAGMRGFTIEDHAAFELADRSGKLLTGLHKKMSTT